MKRIHLALSPDLTTVLLLLCGLILAGVHPSFGQQEVMDTNPPWLKWSQVNTPYFKVVFPNGFETQAKRVANTLEHIRMAESRSLGSQPKPLTVILQNQSSASNGFVSVLPRRSEFYTMPSQDYNFMGTNDWLDILASHEYRHVVQYQHANRGFTRAFYYVFGATTMAGLAHVAAPQWFWEGDAVVTETAFTRSGRGKIPNFQLLFKTNLLEGRTFNYHKQYLRSFKHNIPDHYVLGYNMVSYLRKRTNDPEIWGKITARSWSVPFIPFAFSNAIKKEAGLTVTRLYREMANDLRQTWQRQIDTLRLSTFSRVEMKRRAYTDFHYPQQLADGRIVAMKSGIGDIVQFVAMGDQAETIFIPGIINDSGMLSAKGSTIVWNEYGYDPRWLVRNYSLIKAYDVKSRKVKVIGGKHSRYGAAAISPDESKIVTIHTGSDYETRTVILSYPEGKILKEFPNPENDFYSMPRWSEDGKQIVSLKTSSKGRTIVVIEPESGLEKQVIPYGKENAGHPVLFGDYVLYNSPVTGIDNIYAVNMNDGRRYQITTSKYGAYNPCISSDGKRIYYNDQTRDGMDVVHIPYEPSAWIPFEPRQPEDTLYKHLLEQENNPDLFSDVPQKDLVVTKFHKARGIIHPYTWGFFVNNDLTEGNIGISSRDLLSTTRVDVGYNFDIAERTSSLQALVSYQGLFPVIDLAASASRRSVTERYTDQDVTFQWNEKNIEAGLRIPLLLTSSRYLRNLTIGNHIGLTNVSGFRNNVGDGGRAPFGEPLLDYLDNGNLIYNQFSLSATRLLKRSRRDINSRWGQRLAVVHQSTPFMGDFYGQLLAATGYLYVPGILKHHSLWFYGAYQHTRAEARDDLYIFRNEVPLPRGISVQRYQHFYSTSVNYTLPLWYPDIALGPVINIQRLRANLFADYAFGNSPISGNSREFLSVGAEAKIDMNLFRFLQPFDIGVRFSQTFQPENYTIEILLGTIPF